MSSSKPPQLIRLSGAAVAAAAICSIALPLCAAEPLTERDALNAARHSVQKECTSETPCSLSAMRRKELWLVEVTFTKRDAMNGRPYSYPGGHATILVDAQGKVVRRIDGDAR